MHDFQYVVPIAIRGNLLVFGTNDSVNAMDLTTREIVWRQRAEIGASAVGDTLWFGNSGSRESMIWQREPRSGLRVISSRKPMPHIRTPWREWEEFLSVAERPSRSRPAPSGRRLVAFFTWSAIVAPGRPSSC